jgi:hypothetical protein
VIKPGFTDEGSGKADNKTLASGDNQSRLSSI